MLAYLLTYLLTYLLNGLLTYFLNTSANSYLMYCEVYNILIYRKLRKLRTLNLSCLLYTSDAADE